MTLETQAQQGWLDLLEPKAAKDNPDFRVFQVLLAPQDPQVPRESLAEMALLDREDTQGLPGVQESPV